jgi:hypothetical protein
VRAAAPPRVRRALIPKVFTKQRQLPWQDGEAAGFQTPEVIANLAIVIAELPKQPFVTHVGNRSWQTLKRSNQPTIQVI